MADKHFHNPDVRPVEQNKLQEKENAFVTPPEPRSFATAFSPAFLKGYHKGVMNYTYKGVSCLKSPIDLAIYMKLIFEVKPATIVEIGSFNGGSAIFYRDLARMYGMDIDIITVDFRDVVDFDQTEEEGIKFIKADASDLSNSDFHGVAQALKRPVLAIEDSAHTFEVTYNVIDYFKDFLMSGEYLIVEDGVIEDQGGNWRYDGGPNRAVYEFLKNHPGVFEIDKNYTDFFGVNATFNPNGYLVKS